ncbi:MAG: hypothetical protein RSC29_06970, partial [Oscillospiraceae bacterium]
MFKRTLLITIIAIVTIVGISNIIFTSNVLVNDFMTKAYQLSKQYADSLELKLNNIVETITIFEDKKNLSSLIIDERNSYEVINVLSEIKETNLNIMGATIVNMKGDIFFSSSEFGEVFLNSAISNDYLIYLKEKIIKPTYILKDDFNKNNEYAYTAQELLLYVKPLSDSGYVTGYMVVISSIDNLIKSLNLDDTLFMEKANLYLYNNNETLLASTLENEKINNKITIDSDMSKGSYRTIDFKHFTTYNIIIDNMLGL